MFSKRVEIRVGYRCNANCAFCYYLPLINNPSITSPTTEQLSNRLRKARQLGAEEIEFTGGEPCMRKDLIELVSIARNSGFRVISIVSNGIRLADSTYTRHLINCGVNDFLISIHGPDAIIHDAHTRIPGSFDRAMTAVAHLKNSGVRCRTTSTITGKNYRYVTDLLEMLIHLDVDCIHLPVFSPVAHAPLDDREMFVRYSDASTEIKRGIASVKTDLPPLSVKYIPFCFMVGYEKYVMNNLQQSFDPDEWNYLLSHKIRNGGHLIDRVIVEMAAIAGGMLSMHRHPFLHGFYGFKTIGLVRLINMLRMRRPAACRECRYDHVCDHIYEEYLRHYGDSEVKAIPGDKIGDSAWAYVMAAYRPPGELFDRRCGHGRAGCLH